MLNRLPTAIASRTLSTAVLMNRAWMHHFGKGLVATPGDFGFLGERPTHPELLDWLAGEFTAGGWRLKRMHRLMLTSTAYRQASARRPELQGIDPDNRLLWHFPRQRLEGEHSGEHGRPAESILPRPRTTARVRSGQAGSAGFGPGETATAGFAAAEGGPTK